MTKKEFVKAVKNARYIFAWCVMFEQDGAYIEVKKLSLREVVRHAEENIKAEMRGEDLYIN